MKLKELAWNSGVLLIPHGYSCSIGAKADVQLQLLVKKGTPVDREENCLTSMVEIPEHVLLEEKFSLTDNGCVSDVDFEVSC